MKYILSPIISRLVKLHVPPAIYWNLEARFSHKYQPYH